MRTDSTKVLRVCQYAACGKEFSVAPSVIRYSGAKYCCHRCAFDARHEATYTQRVCQRPGCGKEFSVRHKEIAQGLGRYCSMDCVRAARYGATLAERFWCKVDTNGPIPAHRPELGPCALWTGARDGGGYGKIAVPGRRSAIHASRVALLLDGRPVGEGEAACHHCDNPPCVRASHLFVDTKAGNMQDASRKGRLATGLRHGNNTHPESRPRGEAHKHSVLNPDTVRSIRADWASGLFSHRQLAEKYGVSHGCIDGVTSRRTWKHVA